MLNVLDDLDRFLLRELTKNARISIRELSRKLGIPASTLHDRVKRLVRHGIIRGFTAVLDEEKLGYTIKALILANVDGKHIIEVEREVAKHPNVQMVLDITGEFDVAIVAVFKSISELDRFVKTLLKNPYIKQTRTSIAFRVVKQTFSVPL
ncbi:MAG: Lrp/AsnC family transcriptional regulator [Thermoprotei archaeon]